MITPIEKHYGTLYYFFYLHYHHLESLSSSRDDRQYRTLTVLRISSSFLLGSIAVQVKQLPQTSIIKMTPTNHSDATTSTEGAASSQKIAAQSQDAALFISDMLSQMVRKI